MSNVAENSFTQMLKPLPDSLGPAFETTIRNVFFFFTIFLPILSANNLNNLKVVSVFENSKNSCRIHEVIEHNSLQICSFACLWHFGMIFGKPLIDVFLENLYLYYFIKFFCQNSSKCLINYQNFLIFLMLMFFFFVNKLCSGIKMAEVRDCVSDSVEIHI